VKLYQFSKVFWDYPEPPEGSRVVAAAAARGGLAPERPLRKLPVASEPLRRTRFLSAPTARRAQGKLNHVSEIEEMCVRTSCHKGNLPFTARERCETPEPSLVLSEKATSERVKKRGLHRPLTRDSILLKVNAIQKEQCKDEAGVNMESNAGLQDSWGPRSSQDPRHLHDRRQNQQDRMWSAQDVHPPRAKTCVPILKRAGGQNGTNAIRGRDVGTAPADTPRRSLPDPGHAIKTGSSLPRISLVGPLRPGGLTVTQLEDCWVKRDLTRGCEHKLPQGNKKQEKSHMYSAL